jgi:hypothetical protein
VSCLNVFFGCTRIDLSRNQKIQVFTALPVLKKPLQYSKAPHKRTSRLRTTSLKFGQLSTQNTIFKKFFQV